MDRGSGSARCARLGICLARILLPPISSTRIAILPDRTVARPELRLPTPLPPQAETQGRLSQTIVVAYGLPSFAGAAMAIPIAVHLSIFYADVILVPLGLIAAGKAVARAFDAVTDPLMGWISDRTRTRWGRRRPWVAIGAPLASVAFYLLFVPPESLNVVESGAWFLVTYVLYYLFHTVYSIAHYGLGPELTLDYKDRVTLFGWERGFTVLGTLCAAALPGILQNYYPPREAMAIFSAIFGGLLTVLYVHLVWRVRERPDFAMRPANPLVPGVRRITPRGQQQQRDQQ